MRELKPKLMLADSGRRRRGLGGGFWSFLTFLVVFFVGVYVGTKIDDLGFTGGEPSQVRKESAADRIPVKYEKSTGSLIYKDEISVGEKNTSADEPVVFTGEKRISEELISADPVLSVSENKTDSGLTSIDPEQMSGESKTGEDAALAEPGNTSPDAAKAETSQTEQTGKSRYTLQVGAFADKADAEKAVNEYRSKGFNAYAVQVENSRGETWNLVKIGKYSSIEQAWSQSAIFKRSEGKEAYVETLGKKTVFNESWDKSEKTDE